MTKGTMAESDRQPQTNRNVKEMGSAVKLNACLCTRGLDSAFFTDDGWFLFAYAEGRYKDD